MKKNSEQDIYFRIFYHHTPSNDNLCKYYDPNTHTIKLPNFSIIQKDPF